MPEVKRYNGIQSLSRIRGESMFNYEDMKTIPQRLEEIAAEFCDKYCKYPETWDEEKEGCELCESEACANCPINRLT